MSIVWLNGEPVAWTDSNGTTWVLGNAVEDVGIATVTGTAAGAGVATGTVAGTVTPHEWRQERRYLASMNITQQRASHY